MGYVWLKFVGEEDDEGRSIVDKQKVVAVKTTDGINFEEGYEIIVKKGSIFLCEGEKARKSYTYEECRTDADNPENNSYEFGGSRYIEPTEQQKEQYYEKRRKYEIQEQEKLEVFRIKRKALLHYLCENQDHHIFGKSGLEVSIMFDRVFSRIKEKHHEYLPKEQVESLDFSDILESLKKDKYIRYYPGTILHKIVILNDFYKIPEIKKAKDEHEVKQNEKYGRMNKDIKGFYVFPFKENPRIQLNGSVVILGDKVIDLNNKEAVEKIKNDYERFESNADEVKKSGKNALNETIKGNFYIALRILLSALDKSVGIRDKEGECKFKLEEIKNVYEQYGRDLFKNYVNSVSFNIKNVGKRKASVNALLRRAKVGMKGDQCIQLDNLPKSSSPTEENGRYIIKMMNKITRDGKKTTIDGKKTRDYGKKKK